MQTNQSSLWREYILRPDKLSHKYTRGVAAVYGAPKMTGATRLAASAAARIGAGLVHVVSGPDNADVYRGCLPAHIIVQDHLSFTDRRITARLYGPGGLARGVKIRLDRPCVLDAEAILARPENLTDQTVLTPHEGEFAQAFPHLHDSSRADRALAAAKESGAVIVLKGADTVIAHPDGRVCVNEHASPYLATAGSGDVLAGMITGLLAQGMPAYEAAYAAVWLHGDAARRVGPGLVASDLVEMIPLCLKEVLGISPELR